MSLKEGIPDLRLCRLCRQAKPPGDFYGAERFCKECRNRVKREREARVRAVVSQLRVMPIPRRENTVGGHRADNVTLVDQRTAASLLSVIKQLGPRLRRL